MGINLGSYFFPETKLYIAERNREEPLKPGHERKGVAEDGNLPTLHRYYTRSQ